MIVKRLQVKARTARGDLYESTLDLNQDLFLGVGLDVVGGMFGCQVIGGSTYWLPSLAEARALRDRILAAVGAEVEEVAG